MLQGFKDFISRGNAMDMAVGVIIGAAFSGIVTALNENLIMPLITAIFGKPDYTHLGEFTLNGATVQPGVVLTAILNFLIVAAALYFCLIVPMNKLHELGNKDKDEEGPSDDSDSSETKVLKQIRDLLKENGGQLPASVSGADIAAAADDASSEAAAE